MVSMDDVDSPAGATLLDLFRQGKTSAFDDFDRMSSKIDTVEAEAGLADELEGRSAASVAAERGWFEGRSSLRTWLYRVTTHTCLRLIARRPRRMLSDRLRFATPGHRRYRRAAVGPIWLEPWPDRELANEPGGLTRDELLAARERGAGIRCRAAIFAGKQRAVLILREVLDFSAAEVARILESTPASVNSALQRARKAIDQRQPATTQQAELAALGADGRRGLVEAFVTGNAPT